MNNELHNFTNKVIKCDTWDQMITLSKLAEAQGYKAFFLNIRDFNSGMNLFGINLSDNSYVNIPESQKEADEEIVLFEDFYKPPPELKWEDVLKEAHDHTIKRDKKSQKYRTARDKYLSDNFTITRK